MTCFLAIELFEFLIWDANHLLEVGFVNTSSESVDSLFTLFPLLCRSFLVWYHSICLLLLSLSIFRSWSLCSEQFCEAFPICFLLIVYIFSGLNIWVFNIIWFDFCIWCKIRSSFILLYVDIQCLQYYLMKRLSFPIVCSWHLHQKSVDQMYEFISGFSLLFIDQCAHFYASTLLGFIS